MSDIHARRSVLYMPGSNPRALAKARDLPADGLIMDFEDAVAPTAKADARRNVAQALDAGGYGHREIIIRINGLDTQWGNDDIACAAALPADALLLPKVSGIRDVESAVDCMADSGAGELPIWVMAETPACILAMNDIAAHPRVAVIVMGTADLGAAMRLDVHDNRTGVAWALGQCIMAARAQGIDIIDGVYTDLSDAAGFEEACANARQLGFDGKSLIHPNQIEPANLAFGVSDDEVEAARSIVQAWEEAETAGQGVTVLNGRLVESLHAAQARRTLELAKAISSLEQESG
jgi:citrate lyase subunit beta/citryl-CoA lyase